MTKISEIEETFKTIFEEEEGKVQSVETVYEKSKDEDFYKLIISIHGLSVEDTFIIHTKFIFKTDLKKVSLIEENFIYLYDINCVYHSVEFNNAIDMKEKVEAIIESNNFGIDIQILSDFILSPAMFINYYLKRAKITEYSVFDVKYDPKFKTCSCEQITFDFDLNINQNYDIFLSIKKTDRKEDEDHDTYRFHFTFLDKKETVTTDSLKNVHYFVGSNMARILDEKLK